MNSFSIKDLAKIIERDSKDATYKFALLRGTIEIIQENDNYKSASETGITNIHINSDAKTLFIWIFLRFNRLKGKAVAAEYGL
jgi:hypothetical protein